MIRTDSHVDKLGTREFVFSCHNRAFAATWSPLLPKPTETLIDLELVEFLDIPIKKIEARKVSFAGIDTRIVGHISQTIQCVVQGKTSGTIHLKASVVRHLTKLMNTQENILSVQQVQSNLLYILFHSHSHPL